MNRYLRDAIFLLIGAGSGILLSAQFFKKKYEHIADEEIASVKEVYARQSNEHSPSKLWHKINSEATEEMRNANLGLGSMSEAAEEMQNAIKAFTDEFSKYTDVIKSEQYHTDEEEVTSAMGPHFISPDEFGDNEDYETVSLTYYAGGNDAVIADENDEIVDPLESIGSIDIIAEHIGDYEDDCIHVRNDKKRCDYEILRDYRSYDEVIKEKPYLQNNMNDI